MSHKKIVYFNVVSYIKFYVESAKSHIGDIEKSPKLKHGPFKQNHCGPPPLIHNKEQTQLLAVLFMFNCISAILPRIDPQDHTPCT